MEVLLSFYAVQNSEGKWFKYRGSKYEECWTDDLKKAKTSMKIGPPRSNVTWAANKFKDKEIPKLMELQVTNFQVMEETGRVKKVQKRKVEKEAAYAVRAAKWKRERAERELKMAQENLDKLNKETF